MSDRFDFEQQIQKCWLITDDLYDLSEAVLERDLSHDTITNALLGLREVGEIRFNKLWELFEDVHMALVRENRMLNEECAALRNQLYDAEGSLSHLKINDTPKEEIKTAAIKAKKK